ncbi:hypothetical protein FM106_12050 [Brachybacterium faecium]|nr:hypothetical protein FM106_12050 [Brachybacterium faecium]
MPPGCRSRARRWRRAPPAPRGCWPGSAHRSRRSSRPGSDAGQSACPGRPVRPDAGCAPASPRPRARRGGDRRPGGTGCWGGTWGLPGRGRPFGRTGHAAPPIPPAEAAAVEPGPCAAAPRSVVRDAALRHPLPVPTCASTVRSTIRFADAGGSNPWRPQADLRSPRRGPRWSGCAHGWRAATSNPATRTTRPPAECGTG